MNPKQRDCTELVEAILPAGLTTIVGNLFCGCKKLTAVNIPETVKEIESHAFFACGFSKISLPNGLKIIGKDSFGLCTQLSEIVLPPSVLKIDELAFEQTGLKQLTIPASVQAIGKAIVSGCHELTSLVVDDGNKYYDSRDNCNAVIDKDDWKLIAGCGVSTIPNSVVTIGEKAFFTSDLTSIVIPDSVKFIEENAFLFSDKLTHVDIPGTVRIISRGSFDRCISLSSVTIAEGVTEIEKYAFSGCPIISIQLPSTIIRLSGFDGCSLQTLTIPEGVVTIGDSAFKGCKNLTSVVIPNSVRRIANSAFSGCESLTSVIIPEGVKFVKYEAFENCSSLKEITLPATIEGLDSILNGCSNLKAVYCHVADPTQINIERGVELGGHQATLYVPAAKGVVAAYKKKAVWKKFAAIKPMEE